MTYIRFGIRYLRDVGIVYYDRMEKQTPEGTTLYGVRVTLHGICRKHGNAPCTALSGRR